MGVNKFGIGSIVVGLVLLLIAWFWKFAAAQNALMSVLSYLFFGGMLWVGLFLLLIGILMTVL